MNILSPAIIPSPKDYPYNLSLPTLYWIWKNYQKSKIQKLGPNLSFTVKNQATNLNKIRLLLFRNAMNEAFHYLKF